VTVESTGLRYVEKDRKRKESPWNFGEELTIWRIDLEMGREH